MKREIYSSGWLSHSCSIRVEPVEATHRFDCSIDCVAANFIALLSCERKACEHAIAHELQHLTAVQTQRGRQALEYIVKHLNESPALALCLRLE
jgi:hypothetical protein